MNSSDVLPQGYLSALILQTVQFGLYSPKAFIVTIFPSAIVCSLSYFCVTQ
jgi:hypothetical protein